MKTKEMMTIEGLTTSRLIRFASAQPCSDGIGLKSCGCVPCTARRILSNNTDHCGDEQKEGGNITIEIKGNLCDNDQFRKAVGQIVRDAMED